MPSSDVMSKRVRLEIKDAQSYHDLFTIENPSESCSSLDVVLHVPTSDSCYSGGVFRIRIELTAEYPFKPPKVTFVTPIFHPNVSLVGHICLDILQSAWSPALRITTIILSICSMLDDPNVNSPLNREAASLCVTDKGEYCARIRSCVRDSWRLNSS